MRFPTLLVLGAVLAGCDTSLTAPTRFVPAPSYIEARFESREIMQLASGREIYVVGVYLQGRTQDEPPMYLVQIGSREGSAASLTLYQDTYRIENGVIHFAGGVLGYGQLAADRSALTTSFFIGEERVTVTLPRLP